MPSIAIVYEARNRKTGDTYIGFTSRTLNRRRADHIKGALNWHAPGVFATAIRKYGADAFAWRVVATFSSGALAIAEEQRLIGTLRPAYNATKGGHAYKPRVVSAEEIALLKRRGHQNIDKWRKYAHLGPAKSAKRVVCLNDGRIYESASAAARVYGVQKSTVIEVCCHNPRRNTVKGLVFRYEGAHHGGKHEADRLKTLPRKTSASGYKGISPYAVGGRAKWRAQICISGKKIHLGLFDTPQAGHAAYVAAASSAGTRGR